MRNIRHLIPSLLAFAFYLAPAGAQEAATLIPFQGHLTQPSGGAPDAFVPVPNGEYDILFALYTSPVGGEGLVWGPERHENVVVVNGLVNALLGSVIGFESQLADNINFFARALYVGITIDADSNPNTVDLELVPRQVLLPAIQASNSNKLDGRDWRDFFDGTDARGSFNFGITKAKDANLFDGIDSSAVFVDPNNIFNPKVKAAAVADSIAGDLNLQGNLSVGGNLTVLGDLLGIIKDASGDTGFLRIDDIQICWGEYLSVLTDDGAFEQTYDATPTLLPASYVDSNYAVLAAPLGEPPGSPLLVPRASTVTVYERTPDSFKALTHRYFSEFQVSDLRGWFLTIGRWR